MGLFYRSVVRPLLFSYDSEDIHDRTLGTLGHIAKSSLACDCLHSFFGSHALPVEALGMTFPNPVGLAAGMDKRAAAVPVWESMGFGFCELGGVTQFEQPGNPTPRMFRAISDQALINRMGFNNPGCEALAATLAQWQKIGRWPNHPVGINLGKSKVTPLESAAEDYLTSFKTLHPYGDFFVVNVSSPNTPNLRQLQDKSALDDILSVLQNENRRNRPKPVLVKIAPDLSLSAIDEVLELLPRRDVAGIVATNTTLSRPTIQSPSLQKIYDETGGLSGKPLRSQSTRIVRHIYEQTKGNLLIIGVGGIFTAQDAWEKIINGATLVQIYTSLVYEGPSVVKDIVAGLELLLQQNGLKSVNEAVGSAANLTVV